MNTPSKAALAGIMALLVLGAATGGFYLSALTRPSVITTTTVTSVTTTTQLLTVTYTNTVTSVLVGPAWLSVGAYANYTGIVSVSGKNYTEDVTIQIIQFNETDIEYQSTVIYPSGFLTSNTTENIVTARWLGVAESPARLLCEDLGKLSLANVTVSGNPVYAIAYGCLVSGNDYGAVYLGTNVPFVLAFSHHSTVSSYSEEWTIRATNIPGLL